MKRHIKNNAGFTLLEIMTVILIIAILAAIAVPNYRSYLAEAKATDILVKIHQITMAYLDSSYDDKPYRSATYYDSSQFGKAPEAFSAQNYLYRTDYGIQLASYVMSPSTFFSGLIQQSTPVVFVHASDKQYREVLYALNHILKVEHAFVSPDTLAIPLSLRLASLTAPSSSGSTNNPGNTNPGNTNPGNTNPGNTNPATTSGTSTDSNTGSGSGTGNTQTGNTNSGSGSGTGTGSNSGGSNNGGSSTGTSGGSQTPAECYRHPGWIKNHLHGC